MNRRHAVVVEGGRTLVVSEVDDPVLARPVLTRCSFLDFRNFYLNERVTAGVDRAGRPRTCSIGQAWLAHPDRRQYHGVVMAPGQHVPGALNLWRGFAVTPRAGVCERYREHVRTVICGKDDALFAWVWNWLAAAVQQPGQPAETALVLRGLRGTGKGLFVRPFGEALRVALSAGRQHEAPDGPFQRAPTGHGGAVRRRGVVGRRQGGGIRLEDADHRAGDPRSSAKAGTWCSRATSCTSSWRRTASGSSPRAWMSADSACSTWSRSIRAIPRTSRRSSTSWTTAAAPRSSTRSSTTNAATATCGRRRTRRACANRRS